MRKNILSFLLLSVVLFGAASANSWNFDSIKNGLTAAVANNTAVQEAAAKAQAAAEQAAAEAKAAAAKIAQQAEQAIQQAADQAASEIGNLLNASTTSTNDTVTFVIAAAGKAQGTVIANGTNLTSSDPSDPVSGNKTINTPYGNITLNGSYQNLGDGIQVQGVVVITVSKKWLAALQKVQEVVTGDVYTPVVGSQCDFFDCSNNVNEAGWSYSQGYKAYQCVTKEYTGQYNSGGIIGTVLTSIPEHCSVVGSFQLAILEGWAGEAFIVMADSQVVYMNQFNNAGQNNVCAANEGDQVLKVPLNFTHTDSNLRIIFTSTLQTSSTGSWGICDVNLNFKPCPAPEETVEQPPSTEQPAEEETVEQPAEEENVEQPAEEENAEEPSEEENVEQPAEEENAEQPPSTEQPHEEENAEEPSEEENAEEPSEEETVEQPDTNEESLEQPGPESEEQTETPEKCECACHHQHECPCCSREVNAHLNVTYNYTFNYGAAPDSLTVSDDYLSSGLVNQFLGKRNLRGSMKAQRA